MKPRMTDEEKEAKLRDELAALDERKAHKRLQATAWGARIMRAKRDLYAARDGIPDALRSDLDAAADATALVEARAKRLGV
jgi:predicted  nucleic acid-binding Zn-ribbon protein